ncbi:MAG TPA: hypothetical protein VEH52_12560 [Gaiellaceae bacterium]|nr:hypothetical protein [Gaiellaceae bacterium]
MIEARAAPPGYGTLASDVAWDPSRHVELVPPEHTMLLEDWGADAPGPTALSPVAITSPFRFLSDEGIDVLQEICGELEQYAGGDERIAKRVRGAIYRSDFLRGMYHDESIVAFLRELARAPIEAHPVSHHAIHINYAPDDLSRNVDQWHRDAISFDYVLMVSDPRPMKGGRFEYFLGPVEEGRSLLEDGTGLPVDRVASPDFPGPGWAVLQQGHRVLHRAARLHERYPRVTIVGSYWTPVPDRADPTDLPTLMKIDGPDIALVEWSRYQARVAARRLEHFAETKTDFEHPLVQLQEELREIAAQLDDAVEAFDRREEGRLISYPSDD